MCDRPSAESEADGHVPGTKNPKLETNGDKLSPPLPRTLIANTRASGASGPGPFPCSVGTDD